MILDESYIGSHKKKSSLPVLKIRFHFADGSKETFVQADSKSADAILHPINPSQMFDKPRVVVADEYSKSVYVCSQINRIDFVFDDPGFSAIPTDYADLVELTEAEFTKHIRVNEPAGLERRVQRRQVGDLLVSFLHLRMRGGSRIYLMNEAVVKLPAESQSYMQRFLSKGTCGIRLAEGGQGYLNLENLIGFTVYPGVPALPVDTWMARPGKI
jgi:hypothetical protein